ncbi:MULTISPECIES: hypothetical protein [Pseudonocardia]|uniref:Uncharacterized protein n=2 Tax=Pseudonocardia TaxID=1847 RepID=A0A1Y2MTJ4_PSEAH|nr:MULTISPECIES: hypothetical protein [Pseudonocardia]OSY38471.1 hypothetical protein BG845_03987 [Pseudonocardia autotrophica]TDN77086.1 hypothetical protein C8E95_6310 [Pseudonocardia autotrophica]BBG01092.1 hypothetical protein Pdca_23010 [Pseudonocardia autotrophica]GEC28785.1 hypothetical protein PSA01_58140 [Pseudonocardia saturnea]
MTDMWDELFEPPDPADVLGDLYELAVDVFDLRYDGSEPAWAAWAWGVLTAAGRTAAGTEYQRGELVLRLLALHRFHREFCARAFGLGVPGMWEIDPDRVVGDHPRLHPVLLGVIAERRHLDLADGTGAGEIDFDVSVAASALDQLVGSEYRQVVPLLVRSVGPAALAASVAASLNDGVRFPLPDADVRGLLVSGPGSDIESTLGWIRAGARPG